MQLLKKTILVITSFVMLFSIACKHKKGDAFKITVNYKNADKLWQAGSFSDSARKAVPLKVTLEEIPYGEEQTPVLLDSGMIKETSGSFTLKGSSAQENLYQILVENGPMVLVVNDVEEMTVNIDFSQHTNYCQVSKSVASQQLNDFMKSYSEKLFAVNRAFATVDSLKKNAASDSLIIATTQKKNEEINSLNTFLNNSLTGSSNPVVSLFVLSYTSRSFQKDEFEKALLATVKKFPEYKPLTQLKATYDQQQILAEKERKMQEDETSWVGKSAPSLSLPDGNGKMISLSDFKGKYLLVDFWASWCGPCRAENPNVVDAYNKFKGKNFAILGVSLDKEKDQWQQAIKDDKLEWTNVSDLKFWASAAVNTYKFRGIPYNILIDPQGKVIAESLRGKDLEDKLAEVLK